MSRLTTIKQAVSWIQDGMRVGIAEFSYQNSPMAITREIVRQGKKDLTIISGPTSGLATDYLISQGCVSQVVTAGLAFESLIGIAPAFRQAVEAGQVKVWECDECIWIAGLKAASWGIPFTLWKGSIGSDIPLLNNDLLIVEVKPDGQETIIDKKTLQNNQPADWQPNWFIKIPAISVDICFVHAYQADKHGFVQYPRTRYLGRLFNEQLLAQATSGPVIASVERIVDHTKIMTNPHLTSIRQAHVVLAPDGAKPSGCNGAYPPDLKAYQKYIESFQKTTSPKAINYDN
ncbi:MAG TPA: hypothetical protein ENN77_02315 [Candidatus Wirthbacteria bacterium]|nr:hypothetical protein [Candidatus Wirthbacteria bacterium]